MSTDTLSQFVRIESFAKVPSKKKKRSGHRPAAGIVAEVLRVPSFSEHVVAPLPPTILFGCPTSTLDKALSMADQARDARGHKLRKDAHILAGCVCSYPVSVAEVRRNPLERLRLNAWIKRSIRWAFGFFEHENVGAIVLHEDESHPHLHILITPPAPGAEPSPLRCAGKQALLLAGRKHPKRHALERQAYREAAMRLQESFRQTVSNFFSHKLSPKGRRRLTRREWFYPWNVSARLLAQATNSVGLSAGPRLEFSNSARNSRELYSKTPSPTASRDGLHSEHVRRDRDLAAERSITAVGGFPSALRAPSTKLHAPRSAASQPENPSPIARPVDRCAQVMTNVARAESPLSVPSRASRSWQGNGTTANQAHTRALSALKQRSLPTESITESAPQTAATSPTDDGPGFDV